MPKGKIDYNKSFIYKLCCKDVNVKEIYVGSTTGWKNRKKNHKLSCNNMKSKNYNSYVYKYIRDNGGWDNWDMVLIEHYNATDFKDLCKKERYWIDELGAELNMNRPYISVEEIIEYKTQYRNKNKERILENKKQYYNNNKQKILEQTKEYRNKNREQILEKAKLKITCECGSNIRKADYKRHTKSKKHINWANNNTIKID